MCEAVCLVFVSRLKSLLLVTAGLVGMFGRRLVSQTLQFQQLLQTVFGIGDPVQPVGQRADLVRDDFGLHKMIVVATKAGKVIDFYLIRNCLSSEVSKTMY